MGLRQESNHTSFETSTCARKYKNDPLKRNQSHNSLMQLDESVRGSKQAKENTSSQLKQLANLHEIRERLIERGAS